MPSIIPEKIIIDVTKLPFGTIRNSDIILPENVELADNAKYVVISVKPPRGIKEEK
jgi:hypothetical protein